MLLVRVLRAVCVVVNGLEQKLSGIVVQDIKAMTAWMENVPWSREVLAWSLACRGFSNRMSKVVLYDKALQLMENVTALRFEPDVEDVSRPVLKKQKMATKRASRYVVRSVLRCQYVYVAAVMRCQCSRVMMLIYRVRTM